MARLWILLQFCCLAMRSANTSSVGQVQKMDKLSRSKFQCFPLLKLLFTQCCKYRASGKRLISIDQIRRGQKRIWSFRWMKEWGHQIGQQLRVILITLWLHRCLNYLSTQRRHPRPSRRSRKLVFCKCAPRRSQDALAQWDGRVQVLSILPQVPHHFQVHLKAAYRPY